MRARHKYPRNSGRERIAQIIREYALIFKACYTTFCTHGPHIPIFKGAIAYADTGVNIGHTIGTVLSLIRVSVKIGRALFLRVEL